LKARVIVTLKPGVLDPQGKAIESALRGLGLGGLESVRQGKIFDIELDGEDRAAAGETLREACERLLANTIVENYAIEIA
jgi:phosphoribosylformylglycinamidine synthase subunit PurS